MEILAFLGGIIAAGLLITVVIDIAAAAGWNPFK